MNAYLLDTNHVSPLVTLHHPLRQRVLTALEAGDSFAINVLILAETLYGISIVPRSKQNRVVWTQLQSQFSCYLFDVNDVVSAVELQVSLRKKGRQLATIDALIAVTALRYDLILLTSDGDFEVVPDLRLECWL